MTLGVFLLADFADEIPGRSTDPSIATVTRPASAVLASRVVSPASSVTSTARVSHPHMIGDRVLKISAADVTHLPDPRAVSRGSLLLAILLIAACLPDGGRVVSLVLALALVAGLVPVPLLVPGVGRALLHDGVEAADQ